MRKQAVMDEDGCIRCGAERYVFERGDGTRRVSRFCAVCGWDNIKRALGIEEREGAVKT